MDLVDFLTILRQPSTALVVYFFRISAEYSKKVVNCAQFLSHDFRIFGYFFIPLFAELFLSVLSVIEIYSAINFLSLPKNLVEI